MNKFFSVVWCKALHQLVVTSELATRARGGSATTAGPRSMPLRAALFGALVLAGLASFSASAQDASSAIANIGFESNSLNGWTTGVQGVQPAGSYTNNGVGASVVTGMTDFNSKYGPTPGPHEWTVTPYGTYMASLQPGDSDVMFAGAASALGLSAASQAAITAAMSSSGGGDPMNAAYLYQDITLNAGDSFTMAWQYVSTDYGQYNDVSITSLVNLGGGNIVTMVNNELSQYALLGATTPGTGNYSTGDYGATGWQIATYSVSEAGTYRLGFLTANLGDNYNSPILFVDQAPGATYDKGVPFGPIAPNEGSSAPVTPSGPTTINAPTKTSDLGSSGGKFDGGTLTVDQPGNVDSNLTVTNNGGVIDQAGKASDFTGTISDDQSGVPGAVTIINSGTGGNVTFSGDNTYTGQTSVGTGATLSIDGDGSIASSSGVTNNGTLDVHGANNDVDVQSLNGGGNVVLGNNDIVITDANGPGATGTISGNGGVVVTGGTQVLGGNNTYTGGTTADNATVEISDNANLGAASGGVALTDGTLHSTGDVDMNRDVVLTGTGTFDTDAGTTLVNGGSTTGTGGLVKDGDGTLSLTGTVANGGGVTVNDGTLALSGNNTYTGGTTVNGGTLQVSDDANLGNASGGVVLNGGTLAAQDDITTNREITVNGGTLAIDSDSTVTANGTIGGNGPLSQDGGTLVLNGTNTYAGGTSVTDGTVQISDNANLGDAAGGIALTDSTLHTTADVDMARDVVLSGTGTIDTDASTLVVNSGTTSGAGGLVKNGEGTLSLTGTVANGGGVTVNDGTLALSGNNTYTGGTTVNGGTLLVSNDANLGHASNGIALNGGTLAAQDDITTSRAITVNGGVLAIDSDSTVTANGTIGGNGPLMQDGGTLVLNGANTYTGGTSVTDGTLQVSNNSNLGDATGGIALTDSTLHSTGIVSMDRDTVLTGTGTFDTDATTWLVNDGAISGTGGLVKDGQGVLALNGPVSNNGGVTVIEGLLYLGGNNTYTGGTTINGGTLLVNDDANLGDVSSGVLLNGGILAAQADMTTNRAITVNGGSLAIADGTTLTANGTVDGTGALVQTGGTLVLNGSNTYNGGTSVTDGTLQVGTNAVLGDAAGGITLTDSTLHTTGDIDMARDVVLGGTGAFDTDTGTLLTNSGTTSGNGGLVKNGEGTLSLTGTVANAGGVTVNDGSLALSGNNTYTGGTTINGGTLLVSNDANLGNASNGLVLNGGTLAAQDNITTNRAITVNGGALAIDSDSTVTANGAIDGTGPLTQDGGTLVLNGANTYGGGTSVANGTLEVSDNGNLGAPHSGIALMDSTLHTTGDIDMARDVVIGGTGTIDTDAGTSISNSGTTSGNGGLVKNGEGTLSLTGTVANTGGVTVNDGTLALSGNNTYTGGTTINGGALEISDDANLGAASNGVVLNGGNLAILGDVTTHRDITVNGGWIGMDYGSTLVANGTVGGTGAVQQSGGTLVLGGVNTYTGGTAVVGGTVVIGDDRNLGDASGDVLLANSILQTTGNVTTGRDITLLQNAAIAVDPGKHTVDTGNISGFGNFYKFGEGQLDASGVLSHTGNTVVAEGTLVLSGNNTYGGDTFVAGGATLSISSDANLGHAEGALELDGGTLQTTGNMTTARDITLSNGGIVGVAGGTTLHDMGAITGDGTLDVSGPGTLQLDGTLSQAGGVTNNAGTLVLGGANTYVGTTTVNGGTLKVSADANLGDVGNALQLNGGSFNATGSFSTAREISLAGGNIAVDGGSTMLSSSGVHGTGGLVKNGTGTLDIEGVASHTGGTTVNDGLLILGGANTYTGGNVINGGTLQVSSDANLGNAANNIAINGGTLSVTQTMASARDIAFGTKGAAIDTANGVIFSAQGDLSGTGGLVKLGGGTLVVSGNNTFTGGTLIDGGVVQIDTGSSLGTGAILLNGGTLRTTQTLGTGQQVLVTGNSGVNVDAGTTTVLSGDITAAAGDGCFIKSGAGKLSLTGKANLGSGTCVQGGTLSANGYLNSTFVQVDKGAWLRGTGVINAPVNVEGTLAAGNSPGTLQVNGTVTMQAGSTLQVDIDGTGTANGAGNYSRVLVTGEGNTYVANGTLAPLLRGITGNASNTYTPDLGTTFRIVTADGGVSGSFASLAQPTSGLAANTRFVAFYRTNGGHSIDLRVAPTSYATLLGADAKRNTVAVAGALDGALAQQAAVTATDTQTALAYAVTGLSAAQIAPVVTALAGEVHADNAAAARNAGLGMQRDVGDHLATDIEGTDPGHRVWANLTRDGNRSIADGQASGFETGTNRQTVGLDVYADNGTVLGLAGVHHDTDVIAHGGTGGIRGNSGLVYAQQAAGSIVFDAMASRGNTDWTTRRADPLGGASLQSRTSGKDTMASIGIRMPMQTSGGSRIEPYANVTWQKVERDAVAERGASPSALTVDRLSENGVRGLVGVMAASHANDPLASTLTWRAGVAVGADTGDLLSPTVHNTLAGQSFDTAAPGVGRGFVQVNASGTMRLGKETYLYGGLTAEQGSSRSAYGVTAGVRVAF